MLLLILVQISLHRILMKDISVGTCVMVTGRPILVYKVHPVCGSSLPYVQRLGQDLLCKVHDCVGVCVYVWVVACLHKILQASSLEYMSICLFLHVCHVVCIWFNGCVCVWDWVHGRDQLTYITRSYWDGCWWNVIHTHTHTWTPFSKQALFGDCCKYRWWVKEEANYMGYDSQPHPKGNPINLAI